MKEKRYTHDGEGDQSEEKELNTAGNGKEKKSTLMHKREKKMDNGFIGTIKKTQQKNTAKP